MKRDLMFIGIGISVMIYILIGVMLFHFNFVGIVIAFTLSFLFGLLGGVNGYFLLKKRPKPPISGWFRKFIYYNSEWHYRQYRYWATHIDLLSMITFISIIFGLMTFILNVFFCIEL